jgi:hypothetical protein
VFYVLCSVYDVQHAEKKESKLISHDGSYILITQCDCVLGERGALSCALISRNDKTFNLVK